MAARKKTGITTLRGSAASRRAVTAILQALSGESSTGEAAEVLGVSLSRYYQLEARALGGMLKACEPRKRGYQKTPEREIQGLKAEKQRLEKELRRHQSLLRAAHRSLGLARGGRKKASSAAKKRRPRPRGKTVLQTLRVKEAEVKGGGDGQTQRTDGSSLQDPSERHGA